MLMGFSMAADPEMWAAFISHLEQMIHDRHAQILPLSDGRMRSGRRGPETNGEWVDTTEANILRLENEVTSLRHTIDRINQERGSQG
jgi:hypothetical protein